MAKLETHKDTYFTTVRGMCRNCREIVPARVFFEDGKVWQQSLCPDCAGRNHPALIADDVDWYLAERSRPTPDRSPICGSKPSKLGCPNDCGPCTWHATPCQLPVLSITNVCNLNCPICFTYNRNDRPYHITPDEMRRTVEWIVESTGPEGVDLINLTGGEPTMHPELFEVLRQCQHPKIGRITMNSNGLRLAEDPTLCRRLAELGVYVILSFNTLDPAVSRELHGRDLTEIKLRAIENLTQAGVKMTLLGVMTRGKNEEFFGTLFDRMLESDNILSLTIQTMTWTGQGEFSGGTSANGSNSTPRHIPVDEATKILCRQSHGILTPDDFTRRPSAHPLCYRIAYLLKCGETAVPLTRLADREVIESMLSDSYLLRPGDTDVFFRDMIDRAYADGKDEELRALRTLLESLFPKDRALSDFERQAIAEASIRTVYIHTHMDEDNFDAARAMTCPDLVPAEPGQFIPACTYNLFYRMKDPRFYRVDGCDEPESD